MPHNVSRGVAFLDAKFTAFCEVLMIFVENGAPNVEIGGLKAPIHGEYDTVGFHIYLNLKVILFIRLHPSLHTKLTMGTP